MYELCLCVRKSLCDKEEIISKKDGFSRSKSKEVFYSFTHIWSAC